MKVLNLPPIIKYFEAFSTFADERFKKIDERNYEVISSDISKIYKVYFEKISEDKFLAYSNDNGTILKGYVGYPIIVVLIDKKILELTSNYKVLKGIKWKELNEKFRNYQKVLEYIKNKIGVQNFENIMQVAIKNQERLKELKIYLKS